MTIFQIFILAIVQGFAELLPVSSSAHVITAEKLMHLDPTSPEMTLLLVMLHTGTMFSVIVYFWSAWKHTYFSSIVVFKKAVIHLAVATVMTGIVGLTLMQIIKYVFVADASKFEIEHLFGNANLMAVALAAAGVLIIISSRIKAQQGELTTKSAAIIGIVQGLCLPFRGFSRSGATISTGLVCGVKRSRVEEFSFALAVVLTPAVIVKEGYRLLKANAEVTNVQYHHLTDLLMPSLFGMVMSFLAGLLALRLLSRWLEADRWHFFGSYCLVAAVVIFLIG